MKLSDTDRILAVLRQQSAGSDVPPTPQNFQRFLCDHGISGGNFYQEVEMDSELVDAHEDISTSRDEVQLHSHTFYEVLYCSSGDLEYLLGTERYRLQKGDIVIIPPGVSHRPLFLEQLTEPYRRMVLWISCSFAERITGFLPELPPCRPHLLLRTAGTQWEMLEQPFRTAVQETARKAPGWEAVVLAQTVQLLVGIFRAVAHLPPPQSEQRELLDEIMVYIEHHLAERISLEQMARQFHVSTSTVSQLFRKRMDVSFYHFVTQRRLIAAKNLIQSGVSLEQTAAAVGFGDYSNFYRSFRREYGITPAAYRQRVRQREP